MTVGSKSSEDEEEADKSYHTDEFYRWHMNQLDPSIALVSQKSTLQKTYFVKCITMCILYYLFWNF